MLSRTANKQLIIESELGMGTVACALTPYEREHIRICQLRSLAFHDSQKAIGYTIGQLGTTCDVRQVFDLEGFFPWAIMPRC
jgi:hypothetical protein